MLDIKEKYCPLPWTSIYHQLGNNSPCHCIRDLPSMEPMQYVKSDIRQALKEDFVNDKFPSQCNFCESRESMGIKSTRKETIRWFNTNRPETRKYELNEDVDVMRLELRFSNLCNFKCRMCEPYSSSELAKELAEYDGYKFPAFGSETVIRSDQKQIEELKQLAHKIKALCFTGGEPFLIKEYYDFMDYLVEEDLAKDIGVEVFTNCSTYNEKFISRLMQFKSVRFVASIDGVGKTAEYIRHGTKWNVVRENILRFAQLPFDFHFNTAISQYTLFDVSNLAKFLMEVYEVNNNIKTKCYAVISPYDLHFLNTPIALRQRMYDEIDDAIRILTPDNFAIFTKEIADMKANLETTPPMDDKVFIEFTEKLDKRRNESFEDVFGMKLK